MRKMMAVLVVICICIPGFGQEEKKEKQPKIDVVFVIDTTGSMGWAIEQAKEKIWEIVNEIASGKPTPIVRVGLVAYKDKGDEYVTKKFNITEDIDSVHKELKSYRASGGGDWPEHVSRALVEAVNDLNWDKEEETLKMLFLIGDAPPHEDYDDGFDWRKACEDAQKKGIIINTISCGGANEAVWKEIARKGEGVYKLLLERAAQTAGRVSREAEFGRGGGGKEASAVPGKSAPGGVESSWRNKLKDVADGKRKVEDLKEEEMPETLRKMKPEERTKEIERMVEEVRKEESEFEKAITEIIKKKAAEKGIEYDKEKKGDEKKEKEGEKK
ncbi:MAG: VWA domain-containing protein [Planctomycetota bacterium]|nr:VWA domain-containing protein [Planctomycetota bacterium]